MSQGRARVHGVVVVVDGATVMVMAGLPSYADLGAPHVSLPHLSPLHSPFISPFLSILFSLLPTSPSHLSSLISPWICSPYRFVARSSGGDSSARAANGVVATSAAAAADRRPRTKPGAAAARARASRANPRRRRKGAMAGVVTQGSPVGWRGNWLMEVN